MKSPVAHRFFFSTLASVGRRLPSSQAMACVDFFNRSGVFDLGINEARGSRRCMVGGTRLDCFRGRRCRSSNRSHKRLAT